ncbi:MAG: LTA synthase family protein [Bacteroidales bacterium]|nr:LTA synthase family protein [Bacteroidales bacterium]
MKSLKISAKIYLLFLAVFFVFRLLLLFVNFGRLDGATFGEVCTAFLIGWKFDTNVVCFIMAFPVLALIVADFFGKMPNCLRRILIVFLSVVATAAFLVCGADIPYYSEFVTRFNVAAFNEFGNGNTGNVLKMIFTEPRLILYIIPVIVLTALFIWLLTKILNKNLVFEKGKYWQKALSAVILVVLIFFGMRGRIDFARRPLILNDAFFCRNHFLNQLGLNPNYVLIRSAGEKLNNDYFSDVDEKQALAEVRRQLGIADNGEDFPLSRKIEYDGEPRKFNVVVVLMESMKASNLGHFGNGRGITPVLDSLCDKSLFFNNFYSQNTRTCYGIFSTLVSYPAMWPGNPLYATPLRKYESLPSVLSQNGYSTGAVIPHERYYDNIYGFCLANGVDTVLALEDYPKGEVANTWGIPDHLLFDHSIALLDALDAKGRPFFATLLTVSNHLPFVLPDKKIYTPRHPDYSDEEKEIEYADFCIGRFLAQAATKPWYDSTIFVFLGDHGKASDSPYPISLDFVHVPLIIYCPSLIEPRVYDSVASQIDVFPVLMGVLQMSYNNSTFGVDLLRQPRQYAYFMNGDKYGVVDGQWYYTCDLQGNGEGLYHYPDGDTTNYLSKYPAKAKEMKTYGVSNWKTTIALNGNRMEVSRFLR